MAVTLISPGLIPDTGSPFVELNRQDWSSIKTDLQSLAASPAGLTYGQTINADLSATATISFPSAGTDPSSLVAARYSWTRLARLVWGQARIEYSVAGVGVTNIRVTWPSDMPLPETMTGVSNGDIGYSFNGYMCATIGGTPVATRAWVDVSGAGAFRFNMVAASSTYIVFIFDFHYHSVA